MSGHHAYAKNPHNAEFWRSHVRCIYATEKSLHMRKICEFFGRI